MSKECRFTFTAKMPDDVLDQDDVMAKIKPLLRQLIADATAAIGAENVSTDTKIVSLKTRAIEDKPSSSPIDIHHHKVA